MGDEETYKLMQQGRIRVFLGSTPITISDTSEVFNLSSESQDSAKDSLQMPKSYSVDGKVLMSAETQTSIVSLFDHFSSDKVTFILTPSVNRLPRKWKKAAKAHYRRDTKWKCKTARWTKRNQVCFTGRINHDKDGITIEGTN